MTELLEREGVYLRKGTRDALAFKQVATWEPLGATRGDVVLDVGAHIGCYAARYCHEAARVVCYEPEGDNFALLKKNLSPLPQAEARNRAITALGGTVPFYLSRTTNTMGHTTLKLGGRKRVLVESDAFEKVMEEVAPTVLKMDIEGEEHELGLRSFHFESRVRAIGIEIDLPCGARPGKEWWRPSAEGIVENLLSQGFKTEQSLDLDSYEEVRGSPSGAYFTWSSANLVWLR